MSEQTITITRSTLHNDLNNQKRWDFDGADAVLIDPVLVDVAESRYLRRFIAQVNANGFEFRMIFAPAADTPTSNQGDDLSDAWEQGVDALGFTQGMNDVAAIPGPNYPGNYQQDAGEAYGWIIAAGAVASACILFFFNDLDTSADFTLTLRTPVLAVELSGIDAGAPTAASVAVIKRARIDKSVELTGIDAGETTAAQASVIVLAPIARPGVVTAIHVSVDLNVATVSWRPPASDGGSPITSYEAAITSLDDTNVSYLRVLQAHETSYMRTLLWSTRYIVSVRARNADGLGAAASVRFIIDDILVERFTDDVARNLFLGIGHVDPLQPPDEDPWELVMNSSAGLAGQQVRHNLSIGFHGETVNIDIGRYTAPDTIPRTNLLAWWDAMHLPDYYDFSTDTLRNLYRERFSLLTSRNQTRGLEIVAQLFNFDWLILSYEITNGIVHGMELCVTPRSATADAQWPLFVTNWIRWLYPFLTDLTVIVCDSIALSANLNTAQAGITLIHATLTPA